MHKVLHSVSEKTTPMLHNLTSTYINSFWWFLYLIFWKQIYDRPVCWGTPKQRVKVVPGKHPQHLTGCHSNILGRLPNEYRDNHPHQYTYETCKVGQDRSRTFCNIWRDKPIFASVIVNSVNSGVSGLNVTKIVHSVEKFILFNLLKLELQYCNLFPNGSATK